MTALFSSPARPLAEIINDCHRWYSETLAALFYSDAGLAASSLPPLYAEWVEHPHTMTAFRMRVLEKLQKNAEQMNTGLSEAKRSRPPEASDFQKFSKAYEVFMAGLNDLQCEFLLDSKGVDIQTGFKSQALVMPEMKREFERRGRQGNAFSVTMLRIENGEGAEDSEARMRIMAAAVNQCLRGFDDVYRLNESDILVSLKLSDIKGGLRFVERLKSELNLLNAKFTFSSCVAEPDPSSDLVKFIKDLEADLAIASAHGGGQTIKFEEVSPMQRFIASMKEKS